MKLRDRIEAALSAADALAEAARELNDGPDSEHVTAMIRAYTKAARGLDLRPFYDRGECITSPTLER